MDNPATKDYKNSPSNIQIAFFELVLGISSTEKQYVLEKNQNYAIIHSQQTKETSRDSRKSLHLAKKNCPSLSFLCLGF